MRIETEPNRENPERFQPYESESSDRSLAVHDEEEVNNYLSPNAIFINFDLTHRLTLNSLQKKSFSTEDK